MPKKRKTKKRKTSLAGTPWEAFKPGTEARYRARAAQIKDPKCKRAVKAYITAESTDYAQNARSIARTERMLDKAIRVCADAGEDW